MEYSTTSSPDDRADWSLVRGIYQQLSDIKNDDSSEYVPSVVTGRLAQAMGRLASYYYALEDEEVLAHDMTQVWADIEGLEGHSGHVFLSLYEDTNIRRFPEYQTDARPRRRPTPYEASVETCRRLRDLREIRRAFAGVTSAGILGGSASYGRFYNVRGRPERSDMDLLIVVESSRDLLRIARELGSVEGISMQSRDLLAERAQRFVDLGLPDSSDAVFSHKVDIWDGDADPLLCKYLDERSSKDVYRLSLHCCTWETLRYILLSDMTKLASGAGDRRLVKDFRQDDPGRRDHQRSFTGRDLRLDLEVESLQDDFLASTHAFFVDNEGQYYPGMLQNLVLPQFDVRWDFFDRRVHKEVRVFRWKIIERLRREKIARPYRMLRLSLSHTRSQVFAPHVVRAVDQGYIRT